MIERQYQNWFAKFRSGNFDVEVALHSIRPVETDKGSIKASVSAWNGVNWWIRSREIAESSNFSNNDNFIIISNSRFNLKAQYMGSSFPSEKKPCRCLCFCFENVKKGIHFRNASSLELLTTMLNSWEHEAKRMNLLKLLRKPILMKKWWWYLIGGISKESVF